MLFGNISTLVRMVLMEEIMLSDDLIQNTIQSSWDGIKTK
jgi:hypothetical protein